MSQEVILYKSALKLNDVLAALAREAKHNLMQPSLNNPPSMEH